LFAVRQAVRQAEPEGPLPVVVAGVTQHTCPVSQSWVFVQATHTGLGQSCWSGGVHSLTAGQQTRPFVVHGATVQSTPMPFPLSSPPLLLVVAPLDELVLEPPEDPDDDDEVLAPPSFSAPLPVPELELHAMAKGRPMAMTETSVLFIGKILSLLRASSYGPRLVSLHGGQATRNPCAETRRRTLRAFSPSECERSERTSLRVDRTTLPIQSPKG
jgi:hypothetical protein